MYSSTRFIGTVSAALLVVLSLGLSAAERGTFILRDGRRETGVLVAHGSERANMILGYFNLGDMPGGTGNLRERAYPVADVVAIDLAGGTPSAQELSGLNRMNGAANMLALRNGTLVYGRFNNIIEGSAVTFDTPQGQRRFGVGEVARVYLDVAAVKTIFRVPPEVSGRDLAYPGTRERDPRGSGYRDQPGRGSDRDPRSADRYGDRRDDRGAGIRVTANRPWTDSGLVVRAGDRVRFIASGEVQFGESERDVAGPEGNPRFRVDPRRLPVGLAPIGALIAHVGNSEPFAVGGNTGWIVMPEDGRLWLGVNCDRTSGNRGAFSVEIVTGRR